MEILKTIILGIIQGITEWLPISSTGHMILVNKLINLHVTEEFWEMFLVVIQFGSILAVVTLYFKKLNPFSPSKTSVARRNTYLLWLKVIIATIPAAVAGFLIDEYMERFSTPPIIAAALIIYGILFILIERRARKPRVNTLEALDYKTALYIGIFQILALIPGTSRSGSTILGAMLVGTSRGVAAEFSFFLAIPVMLGASLLRLLKFGLNYSPSELAILITGLITAYIVSVFAIKFLMGYIRKHDFKAFGVYRIVLGIIVLLYSFFELILA